MPNLTKSCTEIIESFYEGKLSKEAYTKLLYEKYFETIVRRLSKKWSALERDQIINCYTDACLALFKTIELRTFTKKSSDSCEGYIYYVGNRRCSDEWRKQSKIMEVNTEPKENEVHIESIYDKYDIDLLYACMAQLNETCQKVLKDWSYGYNMEEIATRNGLKNPNSAAVTRKKCMVKLIELLKNSGMEGLN